MASEPNLEPSLLTARALIAWRGRAVPRVPPNVILTHQDSLFRRLAPRLRAKPIRGLFPQARVMPGTGGRIAVAGRIGIGGPSTAMAVEELAAAGVKRIAMVDVAASITEDHVAGDAVVVQEAVAADGTSMRYLPSGIGAVAGDSGLSGRIHAALLDADRKRGVKEASWGRIASLDAPFRETPTLLDGFRSMEVGFVDMETAALFAAAKACGISAASLLVTGDQVLDAWRPPSDLQLIRARLLQVIEAVREELLA